MGSFHGHQRAFSVAASGQFFMALDKSGRALSEEYGLPSPSTVATWTGIYRRDGEDGLLPKRRGRPPTDQKDSPPKSEIETLRSENERLSAEVAYLGKLRALRSPERR
ncbi:helix-turn-helix domain-containing protein [Cryobacterium glucosi]|uniref:Helix-turn-helix domain-containing protein n=2 Tax=Cryobacterium glucosi TaxID=1259175 RepID=A0ABY2IJZ0_9MICO|nr:helix-turn-helix domain-containing protein [Cryobacterium glucosi]